MIHLPDATKHHYSMPAVVTKSIIWIDDVDSRPVPCEPMLVLIVSNVIRSSQEDRERQCRKWLTQHKVMPGIDWGSLPIEDQMKWSAYSCDAFVHDA